MKSKIQGIDYTAATTFMKDDAGALHVRVLFTVEVPSRVAAFLPQDGQWSVIPPAGIGTEELLAGRVRGWKSKRHRPGPELIAEAIAEGCDTEIAVLLTVDEWHLVGRLCGQLRITAGDWFLAAAMHSAAVEERLLDKALAAME